MMYDKLKVVFAVLSVVLMALALAIAVADKSERSKRKAEAERKARVEYRCWCDEWADAREAQAKYLEERGER